MTDDPRTWDEHAQLTNDGKIIWISSKTLEFDSTRAAETLRTDYWIMNQDGKNKKRLTYFNDPSHPDFLIH